MKLLLRLSQLIVKTFAVWMLFLSVVAFYLPDYFQWLTAYIPWMLGLIMFGMGATLTPNDFKEVFRQPKVVAIGVVAQFSLMPLIAFALALGFKLPAELAAGVILVGACPGGTASNVMAYLARGNLSLSVACTSVSTLLAPVLTPIIFYLLASQWIEVSAWSMFISVLQMVLLPIVLGVAVNSLFPKLSSSAQVFLPFLSTTAIILIVAAIVASSRSKIIEAGGLVFLVVILHNGAGCLLGYALARLFNCSFTDSKTIAIEVGMQNSGLGVALSAAYLGPLAAVPSAIFSVWHNVSGSLLAMYWARKKEPQTHKKTRC
ncbi:bile acid:sodium symporter family protein [Pseudomonas sp. F1_0610]|uniref:bile acid:sodium symporter family protein n=1 Tax=Pseudomonas sp. F1_0610 TaxID=3114284 RepID=UPI0039C2DCD8